MKESESIPKSAGAEIISEQFIPDHVFIYVAGGTLNCFDNNKSYTFKTGEYFIALKNRLARYKIDSDKGAFEPIIFCFDEKFLKSYQESHKSKVPGFASKDTFIKISNTDLIPNFIASIKLYFESSNKIEEVFANVKYEELLIILLKNQPELAGIFFDFGIPAKINLEEFMNRNYKFNVNLQRFAFLTGRSLSAFKRDFKTIFKDTPSHWLVQKRLEEAHFLIENKNQKPSEIYLDLGFEALSHFSFAFKKQFGLTPTELTDRKKNNSH